MNAVMETCPECGGELEKIVDLLQVGQDPDCYPCVVTDHRGRINSARLIWKSDGSNGVTLFKFQCVEGRIIFVWSDELLDRLISAPVYFSE